MNAPHLSCIRYLLLCGDTVFFASTSNYVHNDLTVALPSNHKEMLRGKWNDAYIFLEIPDSYRASQGLLI